MAAHLQAINYISSEDNSQNRAAGKFNSLKWPNGIIATIAVYLKFEKYLLIKKNKFSSRRPSVEVPRAKESVKINGHAICFPFL